MAQINIKLTVLDRVTPSVQLLNMRMAQISEALERHQPRAADVAANVEAACKAVNKYSNPIQRGDGDATCRKTREISHNRGTKGNKFTCVGLLIAGLVSLVPMPAPAQELSQLDGLKVRDWTATLSSIERGKISRRVSEANGIAEETDINTCMRALARHPEFSQLPAAEGMAVCVDRAKRVTQ